MQGIKDLVGASSNPASTLKLYDGAAHGVELFAAHQDLPATLVSWLTARLTEAKPQASVGDAAARRYPEVATVRLRRCWSRIRTRLTSSG